MYALVKATIYGDDCDTTESHTNKKEDDIPERKQESVAQRTNIPQHPTLYSIIPNPARDEVNVLTNTEFCENCRLTMYDVAGRLMKDVYLQKGEKAVKLDVRNLQSGIYPVRISDGGSNVFQNRVSIVK